MGVVYKARDKQLGRYVAIKVLPTHLVSDPDRKKRFVQEAKAASALNHPNIITIHEIANHEDINFIVMEYVEGKTLAELIPRRGLKLDHVLKYGTQIASALAKAHSAGIIHRDLKPTNVMVTDEGLVKVLDFGLAKLTEVSESGEGDTRTLQSQTEEGMVIGTLSYMSPEQAQGRKVDARSDIFSFGAVLYEMVTGRRAFQGDSKASTIAAILKEEPKSASQIAEALPKELERVIVRSLRKDRERRWQTMGDLKVALQELKEESDSGVLGTTAPTLKTPRIITVLVFIFLAVVVLAVLGWFWFGGSHPPPLQPPMTAVPLTSYPGSELYPSFSPDGSQVAFCWNGSKQDNFEIYVKVIGTEPPLPLTTNPAKDYSPAWSPDGRWIAFCRDLPGAKVAVILISPLGGTERKLTETNSPAPYGFLGSLLTWSPDSRSLVIIDSDEGSGASLFLYSVETREKHRLTSAPANSEGDWGPAISPDGHTLAFSRRALTGDLHLLDLSADLKPRGEPKRLTSDLWTSGPVWTPDGNEIVFSAFEGTNFGLWCMPVSKADKPQKLPFASNHALSPAVSRQGKRLAYEVRRYDSNIWRLDLLGPDRKLGDPMQFIFSTQQEDSPAFSHDGKRITFVSDRSGNREVWASDSDGTKLVKLTSFGGRGMIMNVPVWSPDDQSIAFCVSLAGNPDIYSIDANGGAPRRLTTDAANDGWPHWSRDGQWLYFRSTRKGSEIWKIPSKGGEAIQVTRDDGADLPHESPDGKWLYYSKGWPNPQSVWRMPVEGGEATKVLDAVHPKALWTTGKDGIYFFTVPEAKGHTDLNLKEFATGKLRKIRTIERPVEWPMTVSADGRTILYSQLDEVGSDLMLVENFR
jgi:Tol biopolymer transport system component